MTRSFAAALALCATGLLFGCPDQNISAVNAHPAATVTSHADGDALLEGTAVTFHGIVSDPDHQAVELLAAWRLGGDEICSSTVPSTDGMTSCEALIDSDDTSLTLEVVDSLGAAGAAVLTLVVTPTDGPEASIVSPESSGIYYSDQLIVFEGVVSDAEDDPDVLTAWWESSIEGELSVDVDPDSSGQVVGTGYLGEGEHAVTLHAQDSTGKTGTDSVVITVGPPNSAPACEITAPESGSAGEVGALVSFEGIVSDDDVAADWLDVIWSSDRDGELGTSAPSSAGEVVFSWSDLSVATHTISITVSDEVGATCSDFVVFTVGTPPEVTLTSPGSGEVYNDGDAITFSAEVSDNEDSPTALSLSWDSDLDGNLSTQGADSSGAADFGLSDLSVGDHSLTLTVTDSDGLYSTDRVTFTVNALPTAPTVSISPDPAYTDDDLVATASGSSDPDGSGTVTYGYAWYQSGVLSTASTSATFPASATTKGLTYRVVVTPSDGTGDGEPGEAEVTIDNSVPSVSNVSISPDPAYAVDTLTCSHSGYSDPDGDADVSSYSWTVNGSAPGSGSSLSGVFVGGDSVACTVIPSDGTDTGTPVSDSVVVSNTAPVLDEVSLAPDPAYEGDTLTCTPGTYADDDGDTVVFGFAWDVEGVDPGETSASLSSLWFDRGETVTCTVTPNDGTDDGVSIASNSVTIDNSTSSISSVSISPASPTLSDTLTCSYGGYSDADGDADASSYAWTVDGVAAGSASTLSGAFSSGDTVVCTVTPHDGTDAGTALSDTVTVQNEPPDVDSVSLSPSSVYTDDTVSASVSTSDADGDSVAVSYAWYVDGALVSEMGGSLAGATWFDKDQVVYVVVTPNDGTDDGPAVTSSSLTVLNTAPEAPVVSIDPAEPVEGVDDLVCVIDTASSDADGDSVSYGFTWTVDGASWTGTTSATYETGDTVAGADIIAGDEWTCTATPNDGDEDGTSATAAVTVLSGFGGGIGLSAADYAFIGEASGDGAGISVSNAGDVDGDRLADLLVGAYFNDDGGSYAGKAYLVLGASLGADAEIDLADADYAFIGEVAYDYAGRSVSSAGDVDGDGLADLLVGAHGNDDGGADAGKAYLVLGASLGADVEIDLSDADYAFIGEASGDYAGWSVSCVGDVDGDGLADLLVGAHGNDDGGSTAGKAYLVLGASLGADAEIDLADADYAFIGEVADDFAGIPVSSAGDVDGDGLADLLVGAYRNDDGGSWAGKAYLVLGASLGADAEIDLADADAAFIGEVADDLAGLSVSSAGDVDGDGLDDILVGANHNDDGGSSAGKAYLVLGASLGADAKIDLADADYAFIGEASGDYAGRSVSSAGDVDGDGLDDLLVGAYYNADGGSAAGKAYLVLGASLGADAEIDLADADHAFIGEAAYDGAGISVSSVGDVDGDGLDDLLVGAFGNDDGGSYAGKAYLLLAGSL